MKDFNYEIVERIAVLDQKDGGRKTLELNRISYNGRPARFDLRRWDHSDKDEKMLKGLTLTDEEVAALKEALMKMGDDGHDGLAG